MFKMGSLSVIVAILVFAIVMFSHWRSARAALLKSGSDAPDFEATMVTPEGTKTIKLSDFRGREVVLYFYPKDFTPGCTKEACAFRDGFEQYRKAGIVVLGCSVDPVGKHRKFIEKYNLPFPLLADPDRKIANLYGVANGIPVLGLDRRVTYVIDKQGKIVKVFPKVDPAIHAAEVLRSLGQLPSPEANQ